MSQDEPEILDEQLAARLWRELVRAPHDRHHDWRTPTLATQGMEGSGPQARIVVLRHSDFQQWSLSVYTDRRSPKCAELVAQPMAQLIFWSKRLNWQLRVSVEAKVEFEGERVNSAWEKMKQSRASADYLSASPPGHIRTERYSPLECSPASSSEHHLAVLTFNVTSMDWLALSRDGHRRAKLTRDGYVVWLVP